MSDRPVLILDNCVLSSLHCAGWLSAVRIWEQQYDIYVPQRVWEDEFIPSRTIEAPPEVVDIVSGDLTAIDSEPIGQLSEPDWSCIVIAEGINNPQLITNDKTLKETASERGIATLWGTAFVMKTFKRCGISEADFDAGLSDYIEDVTLPDTVTRELADTEKPE